MYSISQSALKIKDFSDPWTQETTSEACRIGINNGISIDTEVDVDYI